MAESMCFGPRCIAANVRSWNRDGSAVSLPPRGLEAGVSPAGKGVNPSILRSTAERTRLVRILRPASYAHIHTSGAPRFWGYRCLCLLTCLMCRALSGGRRNRSNDQSLSWF